MVDKWKNNKMVTLLLIIGVVYFFLRYLFPLFAPVIIAIMIVTLCNPLLSFMKKKMRIKKQYGMIGILFVAASLVGVIVWVISIWISENAVNFADGLECFQKQFCLVIKKCCKLAEDSMGFDAANMEKEIINQIMIFTDYFSIKVMPDILGESWEYIKEIGTITGFFAVMFISLVLLAKDYDAIIFRMSQSKELKIILRVLDEIFQYIGTFLKAQLIIMLVLGILSGIALWFLKIEYGFIWGLLAGFLDALPFIGTGIIFVPLSLWKIINGSFGQGIGCLILYVVCVVIREFLEPKLIGNKIGVYPIAILVSIYAGIGLFGISGIIKGPLGFVIVYQLFYLLQDYQNKSKKSS